MMKRFLSSRFTPSQISKIYIVLGVLAIVVISVIVLVITEPEPVKRQKKADVVNIVTTQNSREFGLDAVNDKVKFVDRTQRKLTEEQDKLSQKVNDLEVSSKTSITMAKELAAAKKEISRLKAEQQAFQSSLDEIIATAVSNELEERQVAQILDVQPSNSNQVGSTGNNTSLKSDNLPMPKRRTASTGFSYGDDRTVEIPSERYANVTTTEPVANARDENLMIIIEDESETTSSEKEIYLPKGSVLTGVLLTGLDAPTEAGAADNPVPSLVRIKKEAVLPNFVTSESVRECFALMAGFGDMSSERVKFRGESISCVRHDGEVIETEFGAYAVGEDGKAGLKGTLVSRNGSMLANTLMAGFAGGLASAFNVNPVPVIANQSDGKQQYQDVFNSSALQGGAAKGASDAMNKLADYYMNLADQTHPVIEVGAGRVVDLVITRGTTL
ncbi:TrbI/VirB10 family protein (plasmid) [Photobacterium leiognathi subsp. mandapamensis]|uniref:TrbI/VirB10 family protein n=1 Tax=Photobacterium leiognathi TaxID=553611 RepID=UPI003AF360E1